MASWFKKSKRNGITYTTYTDGSKPTTWSQSFGSGSYRQTLTHRGDKVTETITRKSGGYTNVKKRLLNKKHRPKKIKPFKPKKVRWAKPIRAKSTRRGRKVKSGSVSASTFFWFMWAFLIFAFSPIVIGLIF